MQLTPEQLKTLAEVRSDADALLPPRPPFRHPFSRVEPRGCWHTLCSSRFISLKRMAHAQNGMRNYSKSGRTGLFCTPMP